MRPADVLRRLRRIRREARTILAGRPSPALAQSMRTVDRACHLAAWQLGDTAGLLQEDDGRPVAARLRSAAREKPAAGRRDRRAPRRRSPRRQPRKGPRAPAFLARA